MSRFIIPGQNYGNIGVDNNKTGVAKAKTEVKSSGISFEDVLNGRNEEIKFSWHAQKRIEERKISIDEADLAKLQRGIDKLKEKGGRESVVVVNDNAYVVSVKNNTVVTVIDDSNLKENVFTNIDSMIML